MVLTLPFVQKLLGHMVGCHSLVIGKVRKKGVYGQMRLQMVGQPLPEYEEENVRGMVTLCF